MKAALEKHISAHKSRVDWDSDVHWIALGYRASPQMSTNVSPFELLYARKPVVPPAIRERLSVPIDYDSTEAAAQSLRERAELIRKHTLYVDNALRIAQHRDSLRYAMVRSGAYTPRLLRFQPGDFVYTRHAGTYGMGPRNLESMASEVILRVVRPKADGTVVLVGRDGKTITLHCKHLAPCHLPNVDPTIDPQLAVPSKHLPCTLCNFPDRADVMPLCDLCGKGYHIDCLDPPLDAVPSSSWVCPQCQPPAQLVSQMHRTAESAADPVADADLHNRVWRVQKVLRSGVVQSQVAVVVYRSAKFAPRCFDR